MGDLEIFNKIWGRVLLRGRREETGMEKIQSISPKSWEWDNEISVSVTRYSLSTGGHCFCRKSAVWERRQQGEKGRNTC